MTHFPLTNSWNSEERVAGLGNPCSIQLSYGAVGSFPRFPPKTDQVRTTQTRNEGLNDMTQEVAQRVPDLIALREGMTPGPWRLIKHTCAPGAQLDAKDDWTIRGANSAAVAFEGTAPEADANARAIAALPDLLDELERLQALAQAAGYTDVGEALTKGLGADPALVNGAQGRRPTGFDQGEGK